MLEKKECIISQCYIRIAILLFILFSASLLLSTTFYRYDKEVVIDFNQERSAFWDGIWYYISFCSGIVSYGTVIVVMILSFFTSNQDLKLKCYATGLAAIISVIVVTSIKFCIQRIRPHHLFVNIHKLGPGGGWSYPSGHTSDAFFLATMVLLLFPKKKLWVLLAYFWAVLVGISRVYSGVHYPSDVMAGAAISSIMALTAFLIIRANARSRGWSFPQRY